jgi:hypothetical protein
MTPRGRRAALLVAPLLTVLLAACSNEPAASFTSATAKSSYEPILREVAAATSTNMDLAWSDSTPPSTLRSDNGCNWHSTTLTSDVDLGAAKQWETLKDTTKQVLAKHGFGDAKDLDVPGGFTGVEATDDKGATLRVESKGKSSLSIVVAVSDSC